MFQVNDRLADMQFGCQRTDHEQPPCTTLTLASFRHSYAQLLSLNHAQRAALPGILPMRANMLVVASVLIDWVLGVTGIETIRTSAFALKEGLLSEMI